MTTRRSFLKNTSILGAGAFLKNDPLFESRVKKIGLQLYTLRDIIDNDVAGVIAKIAAIGFKELEIYGYTAERQFWGLKPKQFKELLDSNGLSAPSSHILFKNFFTGNADEEIKKTCEVANAIGNKFITFPILDKEYRNTLDDYRVLAEKLNNAGKLIKEAGLQFAYHNHDFEFIPMENGQHGYGIILNNTDKDLVKLELDLYWATRAKQDPVQLFERDPGRFVMWHVKDMDKNSGSFTEVGTGVIDFKRIFAKQERSGLQHIFVEQDIVAGDLLKSIEQSFKYVKKNLV